MFLCRGVEPTTVVSSTAAVGHQVPFFFQLNWSCFEHCKMIHLWYDGHVVRFSYFIKSSQHIHPECPFGVPWMNVPQRWKTLLCSYACSYHVFVLLKKHECVSHFCFRGSSCGPCGCAPLSPISSWPDAMWRSLQLPGPTAVGVPVPLSKRNKASRSKVRFPRWCSSEDMIWLVMWRFVRLAQGLFGEALQAKILKSMAWDTFFLL